MTALAVSTNGDKYGHNQWVALRHNDDAHDRARRIAAARDRFLSTAAPSAASDPDASDVRSVVLDSWRRSAELGVDPDATGSETALDAGDLSEYRAGHPMSLIRPVVRRLLVEDAADHGLVVASTDERGRLLWVEGEHRALDRCESINFVPGADWSESRVGTNAPGTSLALDHYVQIFDAEHFTRGVHGWSCAAAPVHHPTTGAVIGAIDITGGPRVAAPEVLSLIKATVAAGELELRVALLGRPLESVLAQPDRLELLGGKPSFVREGRRIPLSRRHAEILLLLLEHPAGVTGEQLAYLLDESELDSVTIRAEVSRLRKVVGGTLLASRPYRLVEPIASDVADVRAALARGDVDGATRRYVGAVLPGSHAPGIIELREEVSAQVRAAIIASGRPAALARWTASEEGREDLAAWTAYRAALSPSSQHHAQASARIAVLDQRFGR